MKKFLLPHRHQIVAHYTPIDDPFCSWRFYLHPRVHGWRFTTVVFLWDRRLCCSGHVSCGNCNCMEYVCSYDVLYARMYDGEADC
jgi:hypothetical protein